MGPVRDALEREHLDPADGWLSARHGRSARERAALLRRLAAYGPEVLEHPDVDEVRDGLKRLLGDIDHHVQRQHDLAYDEVELEIGGSRVALASAEGAGFEPAADISASDRFQGGSDRPLRHPSGDGSRRSTLE